MLTPERKAKIKWQCRRGMLELDLLLGRFIDKHLDGLSLEQIAHFEKLLGFQDPDIHAWLMGFLEPEDREILEIVHFIKLQHSS